jgi:hypothetical protein
MKKIVLTIGLAMIGLAMSAMAGVQTFYGPGGQYQGQAVGNGNGYTFYGPGGQYQGQAVGNGNGYTYYGPGGQYLGQSTGN